MNKLYFVNVWKANEYAVKQGFTDYHFEPALLGVGVYLVKE